MLTTGKNFIVKPFIISEILFPAHLPDAIKLSEKSDAINCWKMVPQYLDLSLTESKIGSLVPFLGQNENISIKNNRSTLQVYNCG